MQLNSKNYNHVGVHLKGEEEPLIMNAEQGSKLMSYLTTADAASHIQITDIDGYPIVVSKYEITRIVPDYKDKKITYKADW